MISDRQGSISKIFQMLCCIVVLIMVGYWLYKFKIEDRDIGVVDYELLEKAEVDFPVVSICFRNPFLEKELRKETSNETKELDKATYLQYLKGMHYVDKLIKNIKYDNVTIHLENYFMYAIFKLISNFFCNIFRQN